MFCQNCGKEIDDKAIVCVGCGVAAHPNGNIKKITQQPVTSGGFLTRFNWIFALISIVASISAVLFTIPFLCVETNTSIGGTSSLYASSSSYLSMTTLGVVFLWVFASIAFVSGTLTLIFSIGKNIPNKFTSFLSFSFSVIVLVFALLLMLAFGQ